MGKRGGGLDYHHCRQSFVRLKDKQEEEEKMEGKIFALR